MRAATGALGAALLLSSASAASDRRAAPATSADAHDDSQLAPPVFEHGTGRSRLSCSRETTPVFLSEGDARAVIREELARVGLTFAEDRRLLPGVPESYPRYTEEEIGVAEKTGDALPDREPSPVVLDGWVEIVLVGFEFISRDDYFWLGGSRFRNSRYEDEYDFVVLARRLATRTAKNGATVGVFYDPLVDEERVRRSRLRLQEDGTLARFLDPPPPPLPPPASGPRSSAEALRLQVRDFIAWLRAQKILPPEQP